MVGCVVGVGVGDTRELKIETFSGRRRPDWQGKPGTEAAVASLQNSNIKIVVNSFIRYSNEKKVS